jgi:formate dehydrogenase major subunit
VYQILRRHFARYTPDAVHRVTGIEPAVQEQILQALAGASGPDRTAAICYAVGWTQHSKGVQVIRAAAILQLLLGNVGRPGGGILALRGHASIQGSTDIPTLFDILPGYLPMPLATDGSLEAWVGRRRERAGTWSNADAYCVSLLKAFYGDRARPENEFGYGWLPRLTGDHSHFTFFTRMADGLVEGLFVMGQNPAVGAQHSRLERRALGQLKWLVVRDMVEIETAAFWYDSPEVRRGEMAPQTCATEVFLFPAAGHAEKDGCFTNTQRLLQWREKAVDPPGDARSEAWFVHQLALRLRARAAAEAARWVAAGKPGACDPRDEALLSLDWWYPEEDRGEPRIEAVLAEINGWHCVADATAGHGRRGAASGPHELDEGVGQHEAGKGLGGLGPHREPRDGFGPYGEPRDGFGPHGPQVSGFGDLRADGSTACGCWIYSGVLGPDGVNRAARREPKGPYGHGWGFAWPADRRILYNRASAGPDGRPWSAAKPLVWWDEVDGAWTGHDTPDFPVATAPDYVPGEGAAGLDAIAGDAPFHLHPDGLGWLFVPQGLNDGPLPLHYEPVESPVDNVLYGQGVNPAVKRFSRPDNPLAEARDPRFPYVLTTYRLTEHHTAGGMSRFLPHLSELQPQLFVEMSPELASELTVATGEWVTVATLRGAVEARALVTARIRPLRIDGRWVHQVAMPFHWGTSGPVTGDVVNDLIPLLGEPNVTIHEGKALLCAVRAGRRPRGPDFVSWLDGLRLERQRVQGGGTGESPQGGGRSLSSGDGEQVTSLDEG